MTLTNKQKALASTVGLIASTVAIAYLVQFVFENVSAEVLSFVFGLGMLLFLASMIYQIILARFEYQDSLSKMVDKK